MREGRAAILALPSALCVMAAVPVGTAEPSIGVATQEADGTIVLQLRSTLPGDGVIAEALVRYRPGDAHYATVARHVGPIPRGGSVVVKPFGER